MRAGDWAQPHTGKGRSSPDIREHQLLEARRTVSEGNAPAARDPRQSMQRCAYNQPERISRSLVQATDRSFLPLVLYVVKLRDGWAGESLGASEVWGHTPFCGRRDCAGRGCVATSMIPSPSTCALRHAPTL
jgi:hypothetical protein